MNFNDNPRPHRGRPHITAPGRDRDQELAHLRQWWNAHRLDLPPAARIVREAGMPITYGITILKTKVPSLATLDKLYGPLRRFGYQPLSDPHQPIPSPESEAKVIPLVATPEESPIYQHRHQTFDPGEPTMPSEASGTTFDWSNPLTII
ncbi:hypothetical protein [Hymenobacter wooponensis]|uniref:Uncharacterized protein n=1 Tax=Hymenobacter wooponensis TaxID=1525360 RepID=A0A4Z0MM33_9BACT|nr:hypothetical protein [Hymenobacter wooponensis]TGD80823.1 hypothetical protein EU557_13550 [Hymenobacter wooponensis]